MMDFKLGPRAKYAFAKRDGVMARDGIDDFEEDSSYQMVSTIVNGIIHVC